MPRNYIVLGQKLKMCESNFLAVHQKMRKKRLATIIVQELLRRVRVDGYYHAYYTSGHSMPTPFTYVTYMNRFLNPERLVLVQYTGCPAYMSLKDFVDKYKLPKKETCTVKGDVRYM